MSKISLVLSGLLLSALLFSSCGRGHKEVKIGNQVWMIENLNVDKFRNGDPIPEAKTAEEWEKLGQEGKPAWCYYDNNIENGEKYGKLYNWYAVNDLRGLAPEGWRIPNDSDWLILSNFLGGEMVSGTKLKSIEFWSENGNGTNQSGFNATPGGSRNIVGTFYDMGENVSFGSTTEKSNEDSYYVFLINSDGFLHIGSSVYSPKGCGKYIRCVKE
jgi:uncharacterized protein (TIGR02145 family)